MPAARERTNPRNGAPDNRRDALVRAAARLGADAKLARLMILGAINFSATWYRTKPRPAQRVDLDAPADETVALVLQPAH